MNDNLKQEILQKSQFPYHRRKVQYQSIDDEKMPGIRNMLHRYDIMKLNTVDFKNKTVLDIGCNLGILCHYCIKLGASSAVGLEIDQETVEVANKYLKTKGISNIKILQFDINNTPFPEQTDYVFALSVLKHVDPEKLFQLINNSTKDLCWFEGHNKNKKEYIQSLLEINLSGKIDFLGYTKDRGTRPVFLIKY